MDIVRAVLQLALTLLFLLLLVRMVFDWRQVADRNWRPTGALLVVAEVTYTVTDPPIKFMNRLIPPLRMGGIGIDIGFTVLIFAIWILLRFL